MKKLSLIMIIVWSAIGVVILAALITATITWNNGGHKSMSIFSGADKSSLELAVDEKIPMKDITEILTNFSSDECYVYLTDDDEILVKHYVYNMPQESYARVSTADGVLAIETKASLRFGMTFFTLGNRSIVEIYLPKDYHEALGIDLKSGSLRFDGALDLSRLSVNLSSGTIHSDYLIKAPLTKIGVTSGSIKLTGGLEAEDYTLKSSSGTVNVGNKLTGSGSVSVTSGSVRIFGVDITDSLDVKSSSGTVAISIAGNPDIKFNGRCSSGTIRTYFGSYSDAKVSSATVGDGPYKNLDVQVTSGSIRITQE